MKRHYLFLTLFILTLPALAACGLLSRGIASPVPASTIVPVTPIASATPIPTTTPVDIVSPTPVPAVTADAVSNNDPVPASQDPVLVTGAVTNVRLGPGLAYEVSHVLAAGTTASILGRNEAGDWWAVPGPGDGPSPVGWVSGTVVTVQGDVSNLPILFAPPLTDVPDDEPVEPPLVEDPGSPPSNRCVAVRPGQFPPPDIHLGPGRQFALIARLGNWAEVLQTEAGWHHILLGPGQVGWVDGDDVDLIGPCQAATPEPPVPVRIQFPAGATSVDLEGMLEPPRRDLYLFQAFAGQRATIEIVSEFNRGGFALSGVNDGQPYKRLEDEQRSWSAVLPQTQDYLLTVAAPANAQTTGYRIFLTIEPPETPTP